MVVVWGGAGIEHVRMTLGANTRGLGAENRARVGRRHRALLGLAAGVGHKGTRDLVRVRLVCGDLVGLRGDIGVHRRAQLTQATSA